jgi:hypothetical protein
MNKNTELFHLIKSLSKSEKRYFKLNASLFHENSLLILLFNILDKQEVYNVKEMISAFKKKKAAKQLSLSKNRLYSLILKTMRNYYADKTLDHQINVMFQNVSFLLHKRLVKEALNELVKIEKIALAHERFSNLIEVMEIRWNLTGVVNSELIYNQMLELLKKIENVSQYRFMQDKVVSAIRETTVIARNQEEVKKVKSLIRNSYFENEAMASTHMSKSYYYITHFFYARFIGDANTAYNVCKSHIRYLEKHQEFIHQNPKSYRVALTNYLVSQSDTRKFNDFWKTIEKLALIPDKYTEANNTDFRTDVKLRVYEKKLGYYFYTLQYQKGAELIPEIEAWRDSVDLDSQAGFDISLCIFAMQLFFMLSNYNEALKWLNYILNKNNEEQEVAKAYQVFARILSLLIYYETGDLDLLEYKIRSSERFLSKTKQLHQVENDIIFFFRNNVLNGKENIDKGFRSLKAKLKSTRNDPLEEHYLKDYLRDFDFISWIDSKIEKKSFAAVVREKALQKNQ